MKRKAVPAHSGLPGDVKAIIRDLAGMARERDLEELRVETKDLSIGLRRSPARVPGHGACAPAGQTLEPAVIPVTSSAVGTFCRAASSLDDSLVEPGDRVVENQILCYVKSVNLLHEIRSPATATLTRILAEEGDPVEYGQTLVLLEAPGPPDPQRSRAAQTSADPGSSGPFPPE